MIGIKAVSYYVPDDSVDNVAQGARFGESSDYIVNKIGAVTLPRKHQHEETSDLAVRAVERLLFESSLQREQIDALVVVTQNGDRHGLPHTSALVHAKLALKKDVAVFDVSLGCSGYVYGLQILKSFMQSCDMTHGVLVTADPYSKIIDPSDRITALLFGDAAAATWLAEGAEWEISRPLLGSDGSRADAIAVKGGLLEMNGRQVFNFAAMTVPAQIRQLLSNEGLKETDIDLYCLHQGAAAIVDAIAKRFPSVQERFILDLRDTGNTVSSTIPILMNKHMFRHGVNRVLLCGFGVGLSWGSVIISRKGVS